MVSDEPTSCVCCGDTDGVQTLQTPDNQWFDLCPTCRRFVAELWQAFSNQQPRAANRARALGNERGRAQAAGGEH